MGAQLKNRSIRDAVLAALELSESIVTQEEPGDRSKRRTLDRHSAMYLCRRFGLSYPEIGEQFNRDHTTVMSAVARIERLIADDESFARYLGEREILAMASLGWSRSAPMETRASMDEVVELLELALSRARQVAGAR